MDLIILLILIVIVIMVYRDVKFLVYLLGILELFFRLIHHIGDKLGINNINAFINRYIPSSLFSIFEKYTTGIVYEIISWSLILAFGAFLYYLVKYIIVKK